MRSWIRLRSSLSIVSAEKSSRSTWTSFTTSCKTRTSKTALIGALMSMMRSQESKESNCSLEKYLNSMAPYRWCCSTERPDLAQNSTLIYSKSYVDVQCLCSSPSRTRFNSLSAGFLPRQKTASTNFKSIIILQKGERCNQKMVRLRAH